MQAVRIKPVQFLIIILTAGLIAMVAYQQMAKRTAKKLIAELSEARSFNQSLAQLSLHILSPNWDFRPRFLDHTRNLEPENAERRIPRIIHQVWDTNVVPKQYEKWIKTWKAVNPKWEHWFWTLDDVRKLVAIHYPDSLVLYDSYHQPIFRADVMRYFVIHHFGGIYVDLDMEALLPLDNWTVHYNCIISEENYEHAYIVREQQTVNILNGFLACQADHSFLKLVIESLGEFARRDFGNPLQATGPFFFDAVLQQYQKTPSGDKIRVVPPSYFFPTFDESESDTISGKCYPKRLRKLSPKGQIVCRELIKRSFRNLRNSDAYTDHYWVHAYMYDEEWKKMNAENVTVMAPDIILAKTKLL